MADLGILVDVIPTTALCRWLPVTLAIGSACASPPDYGYPLDKELRLNQVQAKGTHNSYHIAPDRPVTPEYMYTQPPLDVQLSQYGVRQLELDLHADPEGGGYQVFHVPFLDPQSSCPRFKDCLRILKDWSDANPGHHPLFVWMEAKDVIDRTPITDYDGLDAEIRAVWPDSRLVTPDFVRGSHQTLREALLSDGWPTLGAVRDRAMFMLLDHDVHRSAYTYGETTLNGRAAFVSVDDFDAPFAAVAKIDDPSMAALIHSALAKGLIVGSNVDSVSDTDEMNRQGLQQGLTNGTHLLSTDLLAPMAGSTYSLQIPGGSPSRCHPTLAPPSCTAQAVEDLAGVRERLMHQPR